MSENKIAETISKIKDFVKGLNSDCSDEEIEQAMIQLNPESKGYINPYDYCPVQTAMDILGLKYNRNSFYQIVNQYGLKVYRNPVNNHPFGYKIKEIEKVLAELNKNT